MNAFLQDVRYALRMLRRQPAFTIVAVLTLALGIGGTTAVFTVVNGVLLRPLPYADPDRLVLLLNGANGRLSTAFSPPNYRDVTSGSGVFADSAAFNPATANMTGQGDPQRLEGADVTPTFFSVLGVPVRGRAFTQSDVAAGGLVPVVSDGFWRQQLGARADAIGSTIRLDGRPYTVIGIAPPDVTLPNRPHFWRPLMLTPENLSDAQRGAQWLGVVARLKPRVDLRVAADAMAIVATRLSRDFPRTNRDRAMSLTRLHDRIVRDIRPALLVLLAAVALVLLIACVNVANLLLAGACGRTREVAVRAALGAGRARLVRQFLAESLVLGSVGGAGGLALADWTTRALVALGPDTIPRLAAVTTDGRVLVFAVAITVATGVLFGLVPALTATGGAFARFMTSAGRGSIGSAGSRLRKALVVCEMSLAVAALDRELPLARIRTMDEIVGESIAQRRARRWHDRQRLHTRSDRDRDAVDRLLGVRQIDFWRRSEIEAAVFHVANDRGRPQRAQNDRRRRRGLSTLLFGVSATDPTTFVGVAVLLIVIGLAASYTPARRAARVDPMQALRME